MPATNPSVRVYVLVALLFVSLLAILTPIVIAYCRTIPCKWCRGSWAIHPRSVGDLCRSCAKTFDKNVARAARRRSLLRRILRAAT